MQAVAEVGGARHVDESGLTLEALLVLQYLHVASLISPALADA